MSIAEIGEFGLIARIAQSLGPSGNGVVVGIGDDVAVLRASEDKYLLATCDIQVEGVHFRKEVITPYQLGRKAVAINLSDIASMGGLPRYLLVSLALPPETAVEYIDALYEGIKEETGAWRVDIVGGNMAHSPQRLMIDIFLLGEVEPECLLLRSGARVGDRVLVTGQVGDSAAGLALLLNASTSCEEAQAQKVKAVHLTPTPRLKEGRAIGRSGMATAAIDISDGLVSDLGHICETSGVGAQLWRERLPISAAARTAARATGKDPLHLALNGGEDYELLFTAPAEKAEELAALVHRETGTPVTVIGEIVPISEGISLVGENGQAVILTASGWDHFRGRL